jgi:hypothetical protein
MKLNTLSHAAEVALMKKVARRFSRIGFPSTNTTRMMIGEWLNSPGAILVVSKIENQSGIGLIQVCTCKKCKKCGS